MQKMEYIMLDSMDELTLELTSYLINKHSREAVPRLKKLRDYYEGRHDILKRAYEDTSKPNNRIVANFCKMVSDITQGYFSGSPVVYKANDDNYLMYLEDIYNQNVEENQNSLLSKDASIFGVGYELLYMDEEANVRMVTLRPEEVLMIYDTSVNRAPIGCIRHYAVHNYLDRSLDFERVEVYTDTHIHRYTDNGGLLTHLGSEEHFFGICPVIPYCNNDEEIGDFEGIIKLQDAYNSAVSDQANDFEYTADSYLVINGAEDTEDEEFLNMKRNRLILLPQTGTAQWLVKQTDNATIESYKNRLTKDIHRFTNVPDINSEEFMSDISGTALKYRWQAMEQASANKERLFKESLYARQKAICNILAIKGLHFEYTDVTPYFKRNIPVNMNEVIQTVATLKGIISEETLLAQLPFIDSVQDEIAQIEAEQGDVYDDYYNQVGQTNNIAGAWQNQVAPEEPQEEEDEDIDF